VGTGMEPLHIRILLRQSKVQGITHFSAITKKLV
jgi:hypothetical protein